MMNIREKKKSENIKEYITSWSKDRKWKIESNNYQEM